MLGLPRLTPAQQRTFENLTRPDVLFHGSPHAGLTELSPDRESGDSTPYGSQSAVFATDDPVWAMWFALLNRGAGFRSTRNGAWSFCGGRRSYFFSVDTDQPDTDLLSAGWLYLVPRASFTQEPPLALGLLRSGQWVSPTPVRALDCLPVTPTDFPFADVIGRHTASDSMLHTLRAVRTTFRHR